MATWVMFFDDDCAFCARSIRRLAAFDKEARISFAPLQGELARELGFGHHAAADGGTMVVVRESDGRVFTHSDGWIEMANALGGWWKILTLARWIPRPLRDVVYNFLARHRYRLFGRRDSCALPDPEVVKRLRR